MWWRQAPLSTCFRRVSGRRTENYVNGHALVRGRFCPISSEALRLLAFKGRHDVVIAFEYQ